MFKFAVAVLCLFGLTSAFSDPILRKPQEGPRYQHAKDSAGNYHLVDTWVKLSDIAIATRFNPQTDNTYHLFTRSNPSVSQPLVEGNDGVLALSNFDSFKNTVVLIHGWRDGGVGSDFISVVAPAFLQVADVNLIIVDWTAGSSTINYNAVLTNTVTSGQAVAGFLDWLILASNSSPSKFHIVGHGIGGHQAGVVGRNVNGQIPYITALDASLLGWINNSERLLIDDALYVEAIHTNCGVNGYLANLGDVDFYPNGGESMPGCDSHACDHARSFHYFAESLISGGFTGTRCVNYLSALLQTCSILPGTLQMGGLTPKVGFSGVYLLFTNAAPPFSRG